MRIRTLVDEDFVNYKKPSMFVGTCFCGGKCCTEAGLPLSVCQNNDLRNTKIMDISDDALISRYLNNDISSAIVFGGMEPFEQTEEVLEFIAKLRECYHNNDDVVIYTGYYPEEIPENYLFELLYLGNIIIKFGRYKPDEKSHYDETLGVNLASDNQYAIKITELMRKYIDEHDLWNR